MAFSSAPNLPSSQLLYIADPYTTGLLSNTSEWEKLSCYCYAQGYTGIIMYQMKSFLSGGLITPSTSWQNFIRFFNEKNMYVGAAFGGEDVANAVISWNAANSSTGLFFGALVSEIEWWNYSSNFPAQLPGPLGTKSFYDAYALISSLYNNPNKSYGLYLYIGWTKDASYVYESAFKVTNIDLGLNEFQITGDFNAGGISNGKQYEVGQKILVENYPVSGQSSTYTLTSVYNYLGNTRLRVSAALPTATVGSSKIKTYYDIVGVDVPNQYVKVKGDKTFRAVSEAFGTRLNAINITGSNGNDGLYVVNDCTYDSGTDVTNFQISVINPITVNTATGWANPDVNYYDFSLMPFGTELQTLYEVTDEFWLHDYITSGEPRYSYVQTRCQELGDAGAYIDANYSQNIQRYISFIVSSEGYYPVTAINTGSGAFTIQGNFSSKFVAGEPLTVNNYPSSGTNTTYTIVNSTNSGPNTIVNLTGGSFPNPTPPANCELKRGETFSKYFFLGRNSTGLVYPPKNPIDAYKYIVTPVAGSSPAQSNSYAQGETDANINAYLNIDGIVIFKDTEIRPYSTGNGPNIYIESASPFIPPGNPQYVASSPGGVGSFTFTDYWCDDCLPTGVTYNVIWSVNNSPANSNPQLVNPNQTGACSGTTSVVLNYDMPGQYVITLDIVDGSTGQSISKTGIHTLTVSSTSTTINVTANQNGSIDCGNSPIGSISFTVSGSYAIPIDYIISGTQQWSNGTTSTAGPTFIVNGVNFGDGGGAYGITIVDANGNTANAKFNVTVPAPITATFTTQDTDCNSENGYAQVTATGGTPPYTYEWDLNAGLTNNYIDGLDAYAGLHQVSITDDKGCNTIAVIDIIGPEKWNVTWRVTNVACLGTNGGSIALNVAPTSGFGGPYNYSWSHNSSLNSDTATGLVNGFYTCTIYDVNGCSYTTPTITVTSRFPGVNFDITGPTTVCNFIKTVQFTGQNITGTAPFKFEWSNGQTTNPAGFSFAGVSPGVQTITLTVTDANGCSTTKPYNVNVTTWGYVPNIVVTGAPLTSCAGSEIEIEVTNPSGNGYWNTPGAPTTPLITIDKAWWDLYANPNSPRVFTWTAEDPVSGCIVTQSVTVDPPLTIQLIVDAIGPNPCGGPTNVGYIETTVINGCLPVTWSWTGPPGFVDPGTKDITSLINGDYYVTATDSNTPTPNQVTVGPISIVNSDPAITGVVTNAGCGPLASNGAINITTTGGTAPYSYSWSDGVHSEDRTNLTAGIYTVVVEDDYGCTDEATFVILNDNGITVDVTGIPPAGTGTMNGSATATPSGGTAPYTYLWSNGETTQSISGLDYGTYTVIVTSFGGCTNFGSISWTNSAINNPAVDRLKCCAASISYKYVKERRNGKWDAAECTMNSLMLLIQYINAICSYMDGGCLTADEVNDLVAKANQICGCCACASDPNDDTL